VSNICYDGFLKWATNRFGEENIQIKGEEILTHSVFTEDQRFNLWMNPSGGKSAHGEFGAFRCWYTNTTGSLLKLVSYVDQVSYEEAEELLCNSTTLRDLERKVDAFFGYKEEYIPVAVEDKGVEGLPLPPYTDKIDDLPGYNKFRKRAEAYLAGRRIPTDGSTSAPPETSVIESSSPISTKRVESCGGTHGP
jgi:hypothetical protein